MIALATIERRYYQSRSTNLGDAPSTEMDRALAAAAAKFGTFILDGELYYPDFRGGEHRTGAQAATVNLRYDRGGVQPQARYAIFKALFAGGRDLTAGRRRANCASRV
ncbi:MAG: hypothetical protein HY023_03445 [Chloroflexi bacterium]|nr:hypothetical protein [Chloroflexota bacterium]